MSSISFQNSQNVNLKFQKALITTRIAAWVIDALLLVSIVYFPYVLFDELYSIIDTWVYVAGGVFMIYNLLCEVFFEGQSLGKRVMKIRVVSMDGSAVKFSQYIIRWIFRLIDITLLQGAVAVYTILLKGKGQRLGDILAGTIVISEEREIKQYNFDIPTFLEGYEPTFKNADSINDRQLSVIKKALKLKQEDLYHYAYPTSEHLQHNKVISMITRKLRRQLHIESDLEDPGFLRQLLDDYYFLTSASHRDKIID
ncbi:RDD family protein [Flammeovirga aprica]|uniref:RDD family protein n=1 Tax=Flammeovirga aprica JL-4 TaxID=694437 RepID=A0A7X9S1L9_9BACT|nr:RDD family protein [Flammeovirga aprica]NME72636.1 RDD family protein [Flammeovirga aprica JL-4]